MLTEVIAGCVLYQQHPLLPVQSFHGRFSLLGDNRLMFHALVTPKGGTPLSPRSHSRTLAGCWLPALRSTAPPAAPSAFSSAHRVTDGCLSLSLLISPSCSAPFY